MASEENDNDIHEAAFRLQNIAAYIERYPRPSSIARRIDELRQLVENLAIKAYKGD